MHALPDLLGRADFGRDLDALRIAEEALRELADLGRHGGREQQRLAVRGQFGDDPADVADEAEIEHPVRLVEHEMRHLVELQVLRAHQVADTAGRADDDVRAAAHALLLRTAADAAEDDAGSEPQMGAELPERGLDLERELAGRGQDQGAGGERAGLGRRGGEALQQRQAERAGLAGAGLGDAEQVASLQQHRNAAGLDRGRGGEVLRRQGAQDRLGEAEGGEGLRCHSDVVVSGARGPDRCREMSVRHEPATPRNIGADQFRMSSREGRPKPGKSG